MSQIKDLAEENESLKKQLVEVQENLSGYEKDYDEIVNECDSLRAKLQAFKAEEEKEEESYDDEEAEDDEKVSEEDKEAMDDEEAEEDEKEEAEEDEEKKALEAEEAHARALTKALRNLGVEPVVTKPQARALSKEEVLEKFASISDPKERATFYANNRKVIFN
jgi:DNA repair exonuclease SbcCD ATPase subunit